MIARSHRQDPASVRERAVDILWRVADDEHVFGSDRFAEFTVKPLTREGDQFQLERLRDCSFVPLVRDAGDASDTSAIRPDLT